MENINQNVTSPMESDKASEKLELQLVSPEELETMPFEEMKAMFDENDHRLLNYLESHPVPYFGLHGAARPALEYHKKFQKEGIIQFDVTTFYDNNVDKRTLLNSLYECAKTAVGYAFTELSLKNNRKDNNDPSFADIVSKQDLYEGGIEVLDLETENDEFNNYAVISNKTGYEPFNSFPAPPGHVVTERGVTWLEPETFNRIVKTLTNSDLGGYPKLFGEYLLAAHGDVPEKWKNKDKIWLANKSLYFGALLNQLVISESLKALSV